MYVSNPSKQTFMGFLMGMSILSVRLIRLTLRIDIHMYPSSSAMSNTSMRVHGLPIDSHLT